MADNTEERLKKVLVDQLNYALEIEQIREDTSLYGKGLGLNSLDLVSLVVSVEDEFDIFLEAENLVSSMETFGRLLLTIRQKLRDNGAAPLQKENS